MYLLPMIKSSGLIWRTPGRFYSSTHHDFKTIISEQLKSIEAAGTYKNERIITGKQGVKIHVDGHGGNILNFCANNYLGLSSHPAVITKAKEYLEEYGAGLSSVRFICGTQNIHKELEQKISEFHNREDAILYPSCFDANGGLFEAILTDQDAVLSDELNHASIIDGIRLCKARKYRYKHRDMADLEQLLQQESNARLRLIATDGVFSMDGNVAPLEEICALSEKYNAIVFVDDCHATGFFGKNGRGTEEYFNLNNKVHIINSTLGKALGGASGGYTTGSRDVISLLRQKGRPYLFSNSPPPPVVGAAFAALDLLMKDTTFLKRIQQNTKQFREGMTKAGFTLAGDKEHPICPVMLGDARLASNFADKMLDRGIYVIGFSYPVVPKGKARIRVQISAMHTEEHIKHAVDSFIQVGKELNVTK